MKDLSALYTGVVVNDSDISDTSNKIPGGRVKVLINGISPTADQEVFRFPLGDNLPTTLSTKTQELIDKFQVWAYIMQPVCGESSPGKYHKRTDKATVSDSNDVENLEGIPPASQFSGGVSDGFSSILVGTAGVNPNCTSYSPDNRSNLPKGMFSMPTVGTTVLIKFINNNISSPVVVGILPTAQNVSSIYSTSNGAYPSYPLAFSNIS